MSRFNFNPPGLVFVVALFCTITFLPLTIFSADLKLGFTYSTYQTGDNVKLTISVASPNDSINAISGTINFPTDKLTVSSISKDGSVVNMWVREPAYSNSTGQITFEGAILNPGFMGKGGKLLTVMFVAKKAGTAEVSFREGAVLANDGQGTNVLNKLGQAKITINTKTLAPTSKPKIEVEKKAPEIIITPTSTPEIIIFEPAESSEQLFVTLAVPAWTAGLISSPLLLPLALGLLILLFVILAIILLFGQRREREKIPSSVPIINGCGVIFRGHSNPANTIVLLRDKQPIAKVRVSPDSSFEIILNGLIPGNYSFDLASIDSAGRQSAIQNFPIFLSAGVVLPINSIFTTPNV